MSSIDLREVKATARELVIISGSFAPAGAGAVTDTRGKGFSVSRTGVGTFQILLDKVYSALHSQTATLQLAASADTVLQFGTVTLASKTIVLRALTAGTDADVAANANNRVNFTLLLKNSSV